MLDRGASINNTESVLAGSTVEPRFQDQQVFLKVSELFLKYPAPNLKMAFKTTIKLF